MLMTLIPQMTDCRGLQSADWTGVQVDTLIWVTEVGYLAARGHQRALTNTATDWATLIGPE